MTAGKQARGHAWIDYATRDDLPAMAGQLAELFSLENDFHPNMRKQLAGLAMILDQPALGRLFVIRVDGDVAGMANALITVSTAEGGRVVLLEDIIVRERYRRQGYGRCLVAHILDWAAKEGMSRVTLLADQDNHTARAFYAQLGFQPSAMGIMRKILVAD